MPETNPDHEAEEAIRYFTRRGAAQMWLDWAAQSPVLAEFGLKPTAVSLNSDTDVEVLLDVNRDQSDFDLADLTRQAPRMAARLPDDHAGARVVFDHTTRDHAFKGPVLQAKPAPDTTRIIMKILDIPKPAEQPADGPARGSFHMTIDEPQPQRRFRWRWQQALDNVARAVYRQTHRGRAPEQWPPAAAATLVPVTITLVLALLFALLFWIVVGAITVVAHAFSGALALAHDSVAAQVVLGPIRTYIEAHAAGMPVPFAAIWWAWSAWGIGTLLWSWAHRNPGAKIGWALFGAASVYMTWKGTSIPSQPIAAGLATMWWTAGSVLALRRHWGRHSITAHIPGLGVRRDGALVTTATARKILDRAASATRALLSAEPTETVEQEHTTGRETPA